MIHVTFSARLGFLIKLEYTFTPKYYPSYMKVYRSQEVLYTNVRNSFIHKGPVVRSHLNIHPKVTTVAPGHKKEQNTNIVIWM